MNTSEKKRNPSAKNPKNAQHEQLFSIMDIAFKYLISSQENLIN